MLTRCLELSTAAAVFDARQVSVQRMVTDIQLLVNGKFTAAPATTPEYAVFVQQMPHWNSKVMSAIFGINVAALRTKRNK